MRLLRKRKNASKTNGTYNVFTRGGKEALNNVNIRLFQTKLA